ncbi:Uncharacterised protein [Raoultella terrigena]|uniref:Uncharacterized protein n=1 Tax=Raoultella terrigena TaxID=577 RepID=A0A485BZS6_RAOTE|nr:Uncharacterised protein [Raoultella terrigena]
MGELPELIVFQMNGEVFGRNLFPRSKRITLIKIRVGGSACIRFTSNRIPEPVREYACGRKDDYERITEVF